MTGRGEDLRSPNARLLRACAERLTSSLYIGAKFGLPSHSQYLVVRRYCGTSHPRSEGVLPLHEFDHQLGFSRKLL